MLAYIAMGSNVAGRFGPPVAMLDEAARRLSQLGRVVARSSNYLTKPAGEILDQPEFVNAALVLETELAPVPLLAELQRIELELGRDRVHGVKDGPRVLDLDLIMQDAQILSSKELTLPHPRMEQRAFVLVPLAEIAADAVYPTTNRTGNTIRELLHALPEADEDAVIRIDDVGGGNATGARG